ncbi:MAG: hypothetical protein JF597_47030 [Streptomyces sp.]|uniref:hypothetical protein n=1 Tax=Streptomyces sp. TaxID=1931 RepID=UPI0025E6D2EC|nr:hypothetical protein [Streptomyces sp.]MBW8800848.1 hypothetical protein [Streptomyces sp.]
MSAQQDKSPVLLSRIETPPSAKATTPPALWPSLTCPECRAQSWHPRAVEQGYCGQYR